MPFWSSETLKEKIPALQLVEPFTEEAIVHCAYELAMGPQAVITSKPERFRKKSRIELGAGEPLVIPPGQFGLLLTEEKITVPDNAIAFISIRAGVKFDGLVNVSGFHVDPGFSGRLKFSVYNAGRKEIVICRGDRIFMIWYASLDQTTADVYSPRKRVQNEISAVDLSRAAGEVASPAQLKRDLDDLKHSMTNWKWMVGIFVTIATSALVTTGALLIRSLVEMPQGEKAVQSTLSATTPGDLLPKQAAPAPPAALNQQRALDEQSRQPEPSKAPQTKPATGPTS